MMTNITGQAQLPAQLRLPAKIDSSISQIISEHKSLLFDLTSALGSPLNIIFPDVIAKNISQFKQVLNNSGISYDIFYAHKANKSEAILEVCAKNDLGIDVASVEEFCQALKHGFSAAKIGVSGPIKDKRLLMLALQQQALIQIDSLQELDILVSIIEKLKINTRAQILLRYAANEKSRFGLLEHEIIDSLDHLKKYTKMIELKGFSFHLSGYDLLERAQTIKHLIKLIDLSSEKGYAANIIDIGGGIPIAYLEKTTWDSFLQNKDQNLFHNKRDFASFYPYYSNPAGADYLKALLDYRESASAKSLARVLKDKSIKLLLEPGRSLLDQGGMTIFKVRGTKNHGDYAIVTVAGTSFSLSEQWFNSEFLPDPLLLQQAKGQNEQTLAACIGGASCLESDVISWRKIVFNTPPLLDDLIVYVNTAGYQMDSNESEFHLLPLPQKVAIYQVDNQIKWKIDKQFCQLDMEE